jgi:hypothetical protein
MSYVYGALRGNVVPFTGSFTLTRSHAGIIWRCDDTANVTVTVPADLESGFNTSFIMYSTGTVTRQRRQSVRKNCIVDAVPGRFDNGSESNWRSRRYPRKRILGRWGLRVNRKLAGNAGVLPMRGTRRSAKAGESHFKLTGELDVFRNCLHME